VHAFTVSRTRLTGVAKVHLDSLGTLAATSLAIMGTPGPATISLTAAGSAYGVRRSARYLAGIVAGTWLVLLAVASGITAALLAVPAVRPVLIAAAAAYILWLAYHIATAPPLSVAAADAEAPGLAGGTLLGVANPKAWVAIAAVFASVHIGEGAVLDAGVKVAVLTVMIVVINATWLAAGASLARFLRDPGRARLVYRLLAVVLVAAAAISVAR
jgi:threonine/homoserine/homoserine lactone efflux protein